MFIKFVCISQRTTHTASNGNILRAVITLITYLYLKAEFSSAVLQKTVFNIQLALKKINCHPGAI